MKHTEQSPLAGQTVDTSWGQYVVEDWWDHLTGGSWMDAEGNPAAMNYAMRVGIKGLPFDDEVLYGKIGAFGHLVHVSEIALQKQAAS